MANYANLKATIDANIKANGTEAITGPVLNSVLTAAVNTLGAGYQFMGVATTSTSPGTPDANVFYIAATPGTYTNFGGLTVADGEVAILKYNGSWTKEVTGAATAAQLTQLGQKTLGQKQTEVPGTKNSVLQASDGSVVSGARAVSDMIAIDDGVSFTCYTTSHSSDAAYCLYDNNGDFVSSYRGTNGTAQEVKVFPISGVKYVRFTAQASVSSLTYQKYVPIMDVIEESMSEINEVITIPPVSGTFKVKISKGILNKSDGSVESSANRMVSDYIPTSEHDIFTFSAWTATGSPYAALCLYDSSKNFLEAQRGTGGQYSDYTINKEECAYFRIQYDGSSSADQPVGFVDHKAINEIVLELNRTEYPLSGKKIRIFGGSVANLCRVYGGDKIIESLLGVDILNSAFGGAGYCKGTTISGGVPSFETNSIPYQVNAATATGQTEYDIYILWSSTNDLQANEAGDEDDYTSFDNYDVEKLITQCGGMNYCIKKLQEFAPTSQIIVIGSCKAFGLSSQNYIKFKGMVAKQGDVAKRASLPFYSLWDNSSFNEFNRTDYFYHGEDDVYYTEARDPNDFPHGDDGTHPNAEGYARIAPKIARFLKNNISTNP